MKILKYLDKKILSYPVFYSYAVINNSRSDIILPVFNFPFYCSHIKNNNTEYFT